MRHAVLRLAAILSLTAAAGMAVAADAPVARRTILQTTDAGAGQEVIVAAVDTPAGAKLMRHSHFGVEIGYVAEGQVEGQPARTYKAGDSFMVPRGVVHAGHPMGDDGARTVSTYVVDKGKPLVTPAP